MLPVPRSFELHPSVAGVALPCGGREGCGGEGEKGGDRAAGAVEGAHGEGGGCAGELRMCEIADSVGVRFRLRLRLRFRLRLRLRNRET